MRIHIVASKDFVNRNPETAKQIIKSIQISAVPTTDWIKNAVSAKPSLKQHDAEDVYTYEIENIKRCDGVVAEISGGSLGVGYQVSNAVSNKKPVLCLFDVTLGQSKISTLITGSTDRNIYLVSYNHKDVKGLQRIIGNFIKKIQNGNLVKFNFVTTNEIKRYILNGGRQFGISQSEFLREILERVIEEDSRYNKKNE